MGKEDFDKNPEEHADGRNLEELLEEVESVLERLEQGDISLEESFQIYKNGMELLKKCNQSIDMVEKRVLVLNEDGETNEF